MKVAVLGTGTIGSAVGVALLQSGYDVIAYNRTSSKTEELVKKGRQQLFIRLKRLKKQTPFC